MLPICPMAVKMATRLAISEGLLIGVNNVAVPKTIQVYLLPRTKNIHSSAVQAGLHRTLEEANCADLTVRCARSRAHGQAGPENQGQW